MVAKKRKADFSDVKDGGNFSPRHVPEGDYRMKIIAVEDGESNAGNEQTVFTLIRLDDAKRARPATYPYYCGWETKQLWKIRKLFIAAGMPVPKRLVLVDPNKLLNKVVGAVLVDDEYDGRMRSKIDDVFPKEDVQDTPSTDDTDDDYADDDEEIEETPPSRKHAAKRTPEPEDEEPPAPRRRKPVENDDDEEATPSRRRTAKKAAPKRRPAEDDDDDVDDLDLEEL
jgi:hypothetical protein